MELTVRTWMDGELTNHWCLTDEERPVSDLVDYLYCFTMIDHERWVMARGETEIGPPNGIAPRRVFGWPRRRRAT